VPNIKVWDKEYDAEKEVRVDKEDYEKFNHYNYMVDKSTNKPYREERVDNKVRRYFLCRDICGFSYGDGRVVMTKNSDLFDCRRENLVEGTKRDIPAEGNFWPLTFRSLINFLDKRKGVDEDVINYYLNKSIAQKYSRKRIDLIFDEQTYKEFQVKGVDKTIKRLFRKYFQWDGQLSATKLIASNGHTAPVVEFKEEIEEKVEKVEKVEKIEKVVKEEKEKVEKVESEKMPVMLERASVKLRNEKERLDDLDEVNFMIPDIKQIKRILLNLHMSDRAALLKDSGLFATDDLIKTIMERGSGSHAAMTIQFTSK